jgi:hypothetical protein
MVVMVKTTREEGTVSKTVSLPISRVVEIEKFATRTERSFSSGASYLCKMGLLYVNDVLPDQEKFLAERIREGIEDRVGRSR